MSQIHDQTNETIAAIERFLALPSVRRLPKDLTGTDAIETLRRVRAMERRQRAR